MAGMSGKHACGEHAGVGDTRDTPRHERRPADERPLQSSPLPSDDAVAGTAPHQTERGARIAAAELFDTRFTVIQQYVDILISKGIEWGLLGPREAERVWDRHILNSVAIAELLPHRATVADVGSGAGLPGLPLAILRPDLSVTCIESLLRRSRFLTETIRELGLTDRVTVVRTRAENFARERSDRFQVVTGRAVAPLARLAGWCAPLLGPDGSIVAIKGESAVAELDRDHDALRALRLHAEVIPCRRLGDGPATFAVVARRAPGRSVSRNN